MIGVYNRSIIAYAMAKPLYDYENHLRYLRHRHALQNISSISFDNNA